MQDPKNLGPHGCGTGPLILQKPAVGPFVVAKAMEGSQVGVSQVSTVDLPDPCNGAIQGCFPPVVGHS